MPRLYIPSLGDRLTLKEDWTFQLIEEHRNTTLVAFLGAHGGLGAAEESPRPGGGWRGPIVSYEARLAKGSVLVVDRIFIRKGAEDFDSITFLLEGAKTVASTKTRTAVAVGAGTRESFEYEQTIPARKVRFWVKLSDANTLDFV